MRTFDGFIGLDIFCAEKAIAYNDKSLFLNWFVVL